MKKIDMQKLESALLSTFQEAIREYYHFKSAAAGAPVCSSILMRMETLGVRVQIGDLEALLDDDCDDTEIAHG